MRVPVLVPERAIRRIMDTRLRFCMITTFYPPYNFGGDGVFVHRLSNELARRGHQVEVIHCVDSYRLAAPLPSHGYDDHPNVTVHGLRSPLGRLSPLATHQSGSPLLKSRRIREILRTGFDVIHYHNISLVGGPKVLAYGRAIKLCTLHDYWLVCPTHALFRFNRAPCERPVHCALCSLSYKRPPQWWRCSGVMREAIANVDAFIAPSRTSQRKHEQLGIDARIVHLPNFVSFAQSESSAAAALDEAESGAALAGDASAAPYFLFVGRLERLKGLHTIVPLFRRYARAQLWIAGSGSEEPALRALARGCDNVRFLGHQFGERLQALYRGAVALVYPSVNFQTGMPQAIGGNGAPLVLIEAFSQRTPVIVSNVGRIPVVVAQTGGGLVYATEDELLTTMDRLVTDCALRRELGARGHEAYRRHWTADAHLERYFALIEEIAATRTPPGPRPRPRDGGERAPTAASGDRVTVVAMTAAAVGAAARVHREALAGSRTASMGEAYVRAYLDWFRRPEHGGVALVALDGDGHVVGYAIGAPLGYPRALSRQLAAVAARAVATRPWVMLTRQFRSGLLDRVRLVLGGPAADGVGPDLPRPTMSLVALGVSASARRRNVGLRLLRTFEGRARDLRMRSLRLSTAADNAAARRFYRRCGWRESPAPAGMTFFSRTLDAAAD